MDTAGITAVYRGADAVEGLFLGGTRIWPSIDSTIRSCPRRHSNTAPVYGMQRDRSTNPESRRYVWNGHIVAKEQVEIFTKNTPAVLGVDGNYYTIGADDHLLSIHSCTPAGACRG
jgi:hypothetical protein